MPLWWKKEMVKALYNDDGSVPCQGKYKVVSLKQKRKNLINFVKKILIEFNIGPKISKDSGKWMIRITNYQDMKKFREKIGFSKHYRKQEKLKDVLGSFKMPYWNTKEKILNLLKKKPRTAQELASQLELTTGTIYGHLNGWQRSKENNKKPTQV